ncbi:hypothetical protein VCHA53O466_40457 [Vibrio chagasii]|nr:hypothetical protein VCHA53O466_40457 [Vibrio chagasii]
MIINEKQSAVIKQLILNSTPNMISQVIESGLGELLNVDLTEYIKQLNREQITNLIKEEDNTDVIKMLLSESDALINELITSLEINDSLLVNKIIGTGALGDDTLLKIAEESSFISTMTCLAKLNNKAVNEYLHSQPSDTLDDEVIAALAQHEKLKQFI